MISLSSPSFSLSPEYKNELRNGCYMNSKQYLGDKKAKVYCLCTVEMLSKKYNNHQIDKLFKKKCLSMLYLKLSNLSIILSIKSQLCPIINIFFFSLIVSV